MGLDLAILPIYNESDTYSRDFIRLERDEVLFEAIKKVEEACSWPVGEKGVKSFAFNRPVKQTPYCQPIRCVSALELQLAVKEHVSKHGKPNKDAKPALAYLMALPRATDVYLYWH